MNNNFIYIINILILLAFGISVLLVSSALISISNKLNNKYPLYLLYSMYPIGIFLPKIHNPNEHNLLGGISGIWY